MTTVLFTKRKILWDSRLTYGSSPRKTANDKVCTIGDTIFGRAGDLPYSVDAINWWLGGADPKKAPKGDWELVVWRKNFKPREYSGHTGNLTGIDIMLPHALGSGGYTTLVALECGLDPEEAMKIAYKMDVYSGGPTRTLDVDSFFKNVRAGAKK